MVKTLINPLIITDISTVLSYRVVLNYVLREKCLSLIKNKTHVNK